MSRKKAYIWDIPSYHSFDIVTDDKGRHGVRFVLNSPLTDQERKRLSSYTNFMGFGTCGYRYAPEICSDTVVFCDI